MKQTVITTFKTEKGMLLNVVKMDDGHGLPRYRVVGSNGKFRRSYGKTYDGGYTTKKAAINFIRNNFILV